MILFDSRSRDANERTFSKKKATARLKCYNYSTSDSTESMTLTSSQCCYIFSGPSVSKDPIHLVLRIKYRSERC